MEREIFGPIFPILDFENLDDIIKVVNSKEKPLAIYYFSNNNEKVNKVLKYTTSGGIIINDTLMHVSTHIYLLVELEIVEWENIMEKIVYTFQMQRQLLIEELGMTFLRYAPFKGKLELAKKIIK